MDKYCKDFTGGLCEKTNMHVQRSWCLDMCDYGKNKKVAQKPKKPKKPTLVEMGSHFTKAMIKWSKKGFPVVSESEYIRRRSICNECSGGRRCPKCGCILWAKAALETEKCEKWDVEPVKKYDQIFFKDLHIPCNLTDVYKGQSIFLLCNGPSLKTEDVERIKGSGALTMCVNNGGILKPDLWVGMDSPHKFLDSIWLDPKITKFTSIGRRDKCFWDSQSGELGQVKVKECPNTFFFATGNDTDPDKWLSQDRITWSVKKGNGHALSVFMAALHILWFLGFENIYILGADFKMDKDSPYFFDEQKSQGGVSYNNGLYKAINKQCELLRPYLTLNGFNVYNCTKESGLTSFPSMSLDKAIENSKIVSNKRTIGMYSGLHDKSQDGVKKEIIYCSHNTIDGTAINDECRKSLLDANLPIISVTHKPVDFGRNIVVDTKPSLGSYLDQLILAIESSNAEFLYICEHDCIYHPTHFDIVSDVITYNTNMWRLTPYGFHHHPEKQPVLSACMGPRELLLKAIRRKRIDYNEAEERQKGQDQPFVKMMYEPGRGSGPAGKDTKCLLVESELPCLDIRHSNNSTRKGYRKRLPHQEELPYWGSAEEMKNRLNIKY